MRKKYLFLFAVLFVFLMILIGCAPELEDSSSSSSENNGSEGTSSEATSDASDDEESFNIGMAISMTGGTALFGEAVKRGVDMAVDEFNEAGGYEGKKANIILYDDEAKPEVSVEVVQKLINQDNIVALIGPANTGNALAHIKFVQEAKIPEVIPVATGTQVTQEFKDEEKNFIFRVAPYDGLQVAAILKEVIENQGLTKIGVIHDTEGYGQGGRDDIVTQMKEKYDMEPTVISAFDPRELNLEPAIRDMNNAGVEAVVFYGLAPQSAKLLEARYNVGLDAPIFATWATGDPTVVELVGDLVKENVYFVQSFTIDQSEKATEFHNRVVERYGEDIFPIATAQGYDSAKLILDAIKKVGLDSEAIRDQIENFTDFEGVTAIKPQPFTKDNHDAFGIEEVFIAEYNDDLEIVTANFDK